MPCGTERTSYHLALGRFMYGGVFRLRSLSPPISHSTRFTSLRTPSIQPGILSMENSRALKLNKLLDLILSGPGGQVLTSNNACLFLEAICAQPDPAVCISRLVASKTGLESIQTAMHSNLSTTFFNGHATAF